MSSEPRGRWRTRLAGLRLDVTPLRTSRDFRVLFVAGFVFFLGAMVGYVAVPFQLYALTGSNFAVGAYGLVQLVPLVLAGLYGGALADRLDRRRVLVLTGVAQAVGTAVLLVNALAAHPSLPRGALLQVALGERPPLEQVLTGPSDDPFGSLNLVGGLRRSMAKAGYCDLKEFQKVGLTVGS